MQSYTIHPPAPGKGDAAEATLVADGWSWPGLIFGPFWLAWHRQWIGVLGYGVLWVALTVISRHFGVHPLAASLLSTLLNVAVALEGGQIRRWSLARAGSPATGVVTGHSMREAEAKYIVALAKAQRPAATLARTASASAASPSPLSPAWSPQGQDVIGLFPEKGGR